jgi:hypothetical protein
VLDWFSTRGFGFELFLVGGVEKFWLLWIEETEGEGEELKKAATKLKEIIFVGEISEIF